MIKDYYYLLGLPRSAGLSEIKQAYRKLAALYHPDRVAGQSAETQAEATKKMTEINEAFQVLSDPARKAEYDQQVELIPERPLPKAAKPPRPATAATAPTPQAAPAVEPASGARTTTRPGPRPAAPLDPEYGTRLKAALGRAPLKWLELRVRGWDWALDASELRRGVVVLYKTMESLSLLSARTLQRALEELREERKSPLRKTTIVAAVHAGQLMDAEAVQDLLQEMAASSSGLLGNVQSLVVFREGSRASVVFGNAGDDAQAAEVLRIVQAAS